MGLSGPCSLPILCTISILCVWRVLLGMGCETLSCDHLPVGLVLAGRRHLTSRSWDWATLLPWCWPGVLLSGPDGCGQQGWGGTSVSAKITVWR